MYAASAAVAGEGSSLPMVHSSTDGWFWLARMLSSSNAWAWASQPGWPRYCDCELVDGNLRPDQDPVAVGHLLHLGARAGSAFGSRSRPVAGPSRSAERSAPASIAAPVWTCLLVQVDAAEVQQPAVELEAAADDLDAADPAVGKVPAEAPAAASRTASASRVYSSGGRAPRATGAGSGPTAFAVQVRAARSWPTRN